MAAHHFKKGILLAGGSGTRLLPLTKCVCKQLLPVYDKPLIYYPLATLMLAGITKVLVISTPRDLPALRQLLEDGQRLGMEIQFLEQPRPEGIAQALILAEPFLAGDPGALILGDNIFHGQGFQQTLARATARRDGATVFSYPVHDPSQFGVVEIGADGRPVSLEEKPAAPKSRFAVTGLYFYDGRASQWAGELTPSDRGELEITDLNRRYLDDGSLCVEEFGRGFAWLDTGTPRALLQAANYVETVQNRQGLQIACLEEVAYRVGRIDIDQLRRLAQAATGEHRRYLLEVVGEDGKPPLPPGR